MVACLDYGVEILSAELARNMHNEGVGQPAERYCIVCLLPNNLFLRKGPGASAGTK
jgi:hypothetical protein